MLVNLLILGAIVGKNTMQNFYLCCEALSFFAAAGRRISNFFTRVMMDGQIYSLLIINVIVFFYLKKNQILQLLRMDGQTTPWNEPFLNHT